VGFSDGRDSNGWVISAQLKLASRLPTGHDASRYGVLDGTEAKKFDDSPF